MSTQSTLAALDQIAVGARAHLAAVPDDRMEWRPHEKSMTLCALASHVANLPNWAAATLQQSELDISPADGRPPPAQPQYESAAELVEALDANVAAARAVIESTPEEEFGKPWSLVVAGETRFTLPKGVVVRTFILDHMIHHRAQLGVYLRLLNVPVPQSLGPTADFPDM